MKRHLLAALLLALPASASPFFDNLGGPNGQGGVNINDFRAAENFTIINGPYTGVLVEILRFWTFSQSTQPSDSATATIAHVSWAIYAGGLGGPGSLLQSGTYNALAGVMDGQDLGRREIPVSIFLAPGDYFLEFHAAGSLSGTDPDTFFWANSADLGGSRYRFSSDLNTVPSDEISAFLGSDAIQLAFGLEGIAVPEPGLWALTGAGLAWILRRRR